MASSWVMLFGLEQGSRNSGNEASGAMMDGADAQYLDDLEPANPAVWIRPSRGVRDTYADHVLDSAASINVIALIGHNLTRGSAEWEVELWNAPPDTPTFYETTAPASIEGTPTNVSGSASDVAEDPDEAPDANWITAVSPSADTDIRFRLGALPMSSVLEPGDREQEFRILVRMTSGGSPGLDPTLTVALWQNGSFVSTLLSGYSVQSTTGEVVSVLFNGNLLSGATNIEVRLSGTAANGRTVEYGAVQYRAYLANASRLYRSGWQTIEADAAASDWGGTSPFDGVEEPRKIELMILDPPQAGAVTAVTKLRDPNNADGYISVGCIRYTYGWQPTQRNLDPGATVAVVDPSIVNRSQGNVASVQRVSPRREARFSIGNLTAAQAEQLVLRCAWMCGVVRPYGVCFNPESAFARRFQTIWGRNAVGSLPSAAIRSGSGEFYGFEFRIEEA